MNLLSMGSILCVVLVGLINLLPVLGVLGGARLETAYGINVNSPELEILLRHRALLFGLVGGFVLISLYLPQYRIAALLMAGISMGGFLAIVLGVCGHGAELGRIIRADLLGLVALGGAVILSLVEKAGQTPV